MQADTWSPPRLYYLTILLQPQSCRRAPPPERIQRLYRAGGALQKGYLEVETTAPTACNGSGLGEAAAEALETQGVQSVA